MTTRTKIGLALFVVSLGVFAAVAGPRLRRASPHTHFVAQAQAWLAGRLDIAEWPRGADDPARVEEVELDDGRVVRGRRFTSRPVFRIVGGEEVPVERIARSRRTISYNSFPPFPALLLLPQVLVQGGAANDVAFTVVFAALVPLLMFLVLGRLRRAGLSQRSDADDVWLAGLLGFGTVFFFAAVNGSVWFTAHVVGVALACLYVLWSIEASRPLLAGLALACAFLTRTPMLFMVPLFLLEAWRTRARDGGATAWAPLGRRVLTFGAPIVVLGLLAAWHNHARFGEWGEFGHSYLAVVQQAQMERFGLFNLHYLGRNLAVAFTLLPDVTSRAPYVSISGHGLAMWLTTPVLFLLLWPKVRGSFHRTLWLTVACVAGPTLLYQNSGWFQFGYRFGLDYMVLLVVLLAVGGRPLTRWVKAMILVGVLVNLFGAITFNRMPQFYRNDRTTYNVVVPH